MRDFKGHTYSDGEGEWDIHRLWELAANLPVFELDPEAFHEWDEYGWEHNLTLGTLAEHLQRILEADLSYPVILSAEGNLMDGNHRIVKAWLEGKLVKTVQFPATPPPDVSRQTRQRSRDMHTPEERNAILASIHDSTYMVAGESLSGEQVVMAFHFLHDVANVVGDKGNGKRSKKALAILKKHGLIWYHRPTGCWRKEYETGFSGEAE